MTIFITLDSNNRVVSFREGPYHPSEKSPTEIDITSKNVTFDSIEYSMYDAATDSFINDDYFNQKQIEKEDARNRIVNVIPSVLVGLNYTEEEAAIAIQQKLDEKAKEYQYDNILSAATYYNSTNSKFKADAEAFVKWRDDVWVWAYDLLDKVKKAEIEKPTLENILSQIPNFVSPSYVEPVESDLPV